MTFICSAGLFQDCDSADIYDDDDDDDDNDDDDDPEMFLLFA